MIDTITAESCLIGDLLIEPKLLKEIRQFVSADDFAGAIPKTVFEAACTLADDGQPIDPVTIGQQATRQGHTNLTQALARMMDLTPTAKNYLAHAEAVHKGGLSRRLRTVLTDGVEALDGAQDPEAVCGRNRHGWDSSARLRPPADW